MAETLRDFIIRRRGELDAAEAPLREQLREIEAERVELGRAALTIGLPDDPAARPALKVHPKPRRRAAAEATIKEAVLEILNDHAGGLTALDILAAVNRRLNVEYPRTSLSPQLSRLKAEGWVDLNGTFWSLAKSKSQKEEAADANLAGGTSAASETGDIFK